MKKKMENEIKLPLFNYQLVGVDFLHTVGSGILADSPGLGKTLQAIALCQRLQAKKVLFFTPSAVKFQIAQEINKFLPGTPTVVITGSPKERDKLWQTPANFYIVNYELLLRDFGYMASQVWDVIVADECTKISSARAKQSKLIKKIPSRRRIAMTGTLISNRADEVWNVLDFCQPGVAGNFWQFLNRYCLRNKWGGVCGYINTEDLKQRLHKYMIRRTKEEVLTELPEKIETDIPFEMSEQEQTLYKKLKQEILYSIEKEDLSKVENPISIQNTLVKMTRLRQLADSMELLGEKTVSSKLEVLKELLSQLLS